MQPQNFYIIFEIDFLAILSEATKNKVMNSKN